MFVIELFERKVGDVDSRIIPLDNLQPSDLDVIKSLGGTNCQLVDEIYSQIGHVNRVRNCDSHLVTIDTVRVMLVRECVMLWTLLQGNLKRYPHMDQLCAWLNETKHTHKGELMLIEREVHESVDREGTEVLFGASLEDAMKTAPTGGKFVEPEEAVDEGLDMSDEDLASLFDHSVVDLMVDKEEDEILLTEQVNGDSFTMTEAKKPLRPAFEPDFEVEEGDPDPDFVVELEIEEVINQLSPMDEEA